MNFFTRNVFCMFYIISINLTEAQLPIPDCKTVGRERLYQFRVRAVNIAPDSTHLKGPWSDPGEGNCYSDGKLTFVLLVSILTSLHRNNYITT